MASEHDPDPLTTVRVMMEAFNAGDVSRIVELADPEFEAKVPPEFSAEPDTYRGHEGLRRYFDSFQDTMQDIRFEAEQTWDAGRDVVVLLRLRAVGRYSAIPVEQRVPQVWRLRAGRALAVNSYPALEEAFAAAGLPPATG